MLKAFTLIFFVNLIFMCHPAVAQKITVVKRADSSKKRNTNIFSKPDTSKAYSPRIATYRSAILPGWGQATFR